MATAVLKTFGSLQEELEKAKENLKGVDEHIKRIIGRDPNDGAQRPGVKRVSTSNEEFRGRGRGFPQNRGRRDPGEERQEGPETFPAGGRRRPGDTRTVFSRLSGPSRPVKDPDSGEDDDVQKPLVSSHIVATPRELPSRQEIMAVQGDERSKARNRRMFGALLGTLQKFRQEETRMKDREDKRAQVERKLEEAARKEKEELKKERQELFSERRRKQQEVRRIEIKLLRIKEQEEWESCHRPLMNFIQTKSKPPIFYLPKMHNAKTEERLVGSQKVVAKMMEKKREHVHGEMERLDSRGPGGPRAHRHFEEEENGFADSQKDAFDKENRLDPDDKIDDKLDADEVGTLEVTGTMKVEADEKGGHEEPVNRIRAPARASAADQQRGRHEQSDDEEELEYDEHAKEDDDEDEDVVRTDWQDSQRQAKHRMNEDESEEATTVKRAKVEDSEDKSNLELDQQTDLVWDAAVQMDSSADQDSQNANFI